MIRDCRHENHRPQTELRNRPSACTGSHSGATGDDNGYKERFGALVEVNHGWKKDYEELQLRYEMLIGEKKLLEDEEKELKLRITELEKRQAPLEGEIARLAAALYAQQGSSNSTSSPSEEQCEVLKSQMIVYKEDFEKERKDREKLHEEKEKYKQKLDDAEEIIRRLTSELDACKAVEEARRERGYRDENGYLSERGTTPRHHVNLYNLYQPVDQRWRMEQQRREIFPRNPSPTSFFYGGDVEVDNQNLAGSSNILPL